MTGPGSDRAARITLLADANVLIDYAKTDRTVLALVARHVGPLVVLSVVLDEVNELEADDCSRLGIGIVEATTEQLLEARDLPPRVSFNDGVCLVVCRDEGWTCVTNDRALQRLCRQRAVPTRFGLGLLVDLVTVEAITRRRAEGVAAHHRPRSRALDGAAEGSGAALKRPSARFSRVWPRP